MSLRDDAALYSELSGNDGSRTPIRIIGAYLDGYEKGKAEVKERKTGKWILVTDNNGQHMECNRCGEWRYHQEQKFCGECGARMEVTDG